MKQIFIAVAWIGLIVCTSSYAEIKPEQLDGFREGVTTELEVVEKLGQPNIVNTSRTGKTLIYTDTKTSVKPVTYIPVLGSLVGGADVKSNTVTFMFNKRGKLVEMQTTTTNTDSGR